MTKLSVKRAEGEKPITVIYGLIHPFTNLPPGDESFNEAYGRYARLIDEAAANPSAAFVFVGTMVKNHLPKLKRLGPDTQRKLAGVRALSEDERWLLTVDLYSAGVMLAGHRYEMPEEVSLLLRAMKKIPAGRFNYSESQLDEAEVRRKFGRRTAAKVGVIFDGEKANVCVRGERFALERTLKLGR